MAKSTSKPRLPGQSWAHFRLAATMILGALIGGSLANVTNNLYVGGTVFVAFLVFAAVSAVRWENRKRQQLESDSRSYRM